MSNPMEFIWNEEQHAFQLRGYGIYVRTCDTIDWQDEVEELEEEVINGELDEDSEEYRKRLADIPIVEAATDFGGGLVSTWSGGTPEQAIAQLRDFYERGCHND